MTAQTRPAFAAASQEYQDMQALVAAIRAGRVAEPQSVLEAAERRVRELRRVLARHLFAA